MADMVKMDDWLGAIPSKQTRKCYRAGIKKFEEFYGKPIETLLTLNDEDSGHIIEKFYAWLTDQNRPQNSKRNLTNCAVQYLKYFGKNPKYRKSLGIYKTVESTKDKKLLIADVQELAKVSDLREQVLLETLLLGLRISDVSILEWQPFLEDEFTITTRKEQVTAHIFISAEFRELLDKYLNTLDKTNKFLFQSAKNQHLTTKHIDYTFKQLAKRAGFADYQRYHWHLGRKLVLRTSAELGLSMWSAKMIVGKSIPSSDSTYLQGTALKEDFIKLSKVLTLKPSNGNGKVTKLEEVINSMEKELFIYKTRVDLLQKSQNEIDTENKELKSVLKGLSVVLEPQIKDKLRSMIPDISMGVNEKSISKPIEPTEPFEMLKKIAGWQELRDATVKRQKDMKEHPEKYYVDAKEDD